MEAKSFLSNLDLKKKNLQIIQKIKKEINFYNKRFFYTKEDIPAYFHSSFNGPGLYEIQKLFGIKYSFFKYLICILKDQVNILKYSSINIFQKNKNFFTEKVIFTWAFDRNFNKNGSLYDRYLNINSRKTKKTKWFVLYLSKEIPKKLDENILLIRINNKINTNFFVIIKFLLSNLKYIFINFKYFLFACSSQNFLATKISKIIKENIKKSVKKCLIIYEAQPFQNEIVKFLNTNNIESIGYLHAPPLALPTNLVKKKYSPLSIFVNGEDQKKCLGILGWSKKKIKVIPSFRFLKKKNSFKRIIYLPILIKSEQLILKNLEILVTKFKINLNLYSVKNHPATSKSNIHLKLIKKIIILGKKYKNYEFSNQFNNYLIFIGATGAIIEELERGNKVIQIAEIPFLDCYSNFFWKNIKTLKLTNNIYSYSIKKKSLIMFGNKPKNLNLFFKKL